MVEVLQEPVTVRDEILLSSERPCIAEEGVARASNSNKADNTSI